MTTWKKVIRPRKWRPEAGEVLEGTYVGSGDRKGRDGLYTEFYVRDTSGVLYYVSGSVLTRLFGSIAIDSQVRIVFLGQKPCQTSDFMFNDFDLYVGEKTVNDSPTVLTRVPGLWS